MDALKFIEERNRMCKLFSPGCEGCRIDEAKPVTSECVLWMIENPEKTVEIVEQWAQEHPRKTRQDVFLSVYPNAKMDKRSRTVDVSPCFVDKSWGANECPNDDCAVCRRQFWMQEVE